MRWVAWCGVSYSVRAAASSVLVSHIVNNAAVTIALPEIRPHEMATLMV